MKHMHQMPNKNKPSDQIKHKAHAKHVRNAACSLDSFASCTRIKETFDVHGLNGLPVFMCAGSVYCKICKYECFISFSQQSVSPAQYIQAK